MARGATRSVPRRRGGRAARGAWATAAVLAIGAVVAPVAVQRAAAVPPPSAACPTNAATGGQQIAGYTLSALAAGARYQVNSRGLLPVGDPSEGNITELDVPFARTLVSEGPLIDSLGSPAYPGDTAAHLGTAFATFGAPPQANALNDPVLAEAAYPPSPGHSGDEQYSGAGGGALGGAGTAHSTADSGGGSAESSVASAALGSAGSPAVAGGPSGSATLTHLGTGCVDSSAHSTTGEVDIAGIIKIAGVSGVAAAESDGTRAVPRASLSVGDVTVNGLRAYIDHDGVHLAGQQPVGAGVVAQTEALLQKTLGAAGMAVKLIDPATSVTGAAAAADSGGIEVTVDRQLPALGVPGASSITLPGAPPIPLTTPAAPLHVEVVYGAARVSANATTAPSDSLSTTAPLDQGAPPAAADTNAAALDTPLPSGTGGALLASGPTGSGGGQTLVASAAPQRGLPLPAGWLIIGLLGSLAAAGSLFKYARWQLLEGRI